jgi:predicted kinase
VELVILCGLQASGKSTFRRERFSEHVVVSKDLMRNNRRRERRQRQLVGAALAGGRSVVVDNTNPAAADREALVAIGRAHGAITAVYYFVADLETCIERNASRSGRDLVPYVGLADVARRLERPTSDEGFDEIWFVRAADGAFEVRPLPPGSQS